MKIIIGKSRIVNWAIFIHFIKKEIERSLEKLLEMLSLYLTLWLNQIYQKKIILLIKKGDNYKENTIIENNLESENYY